jgi:hypothetical protein
MAGSKGKAKGNAGELRIAKFLTTLYEAKFNQKNRCQAVASNYQACIG